jgi:dTDP-4-amino-4,6-dideoxygalactose transaminase
MQIYQYLKLVLFSFENEVLKSGNWNMSYGQYPAHVRLEQEFANYIGTSQAVAVSGGGVAIQMALRALGLGRDSEVLMQIDTCAAVPMAALNAQTIPRFFDANPKTFLSDKAAITSKATQNTKAIISSHLWGNPDDVNELSRFSDSSGAVLIEDCCLALGTEVDGKKVGTFGKVGIFSFGSTKPIQAGEGGIIVTDDISLARELRAMRNWGERTKDFGVRDVNELSWNGRISEFSAAIASEQLRNYPFLISKIRDNVEIFNDYLSKKRPNMELQLGNSLHISQSTFSQVVLRLIDYNESSKIELLNQLEENGIIAFHANFEPISTLRLFKSGTWTRWINSPNWDTTKDLLDSNYKNAFDIFKYKGIGLSRTNFQSKYTVNRLISTLDKITRY